MNARTQFERGFGKDNVTEVLSHNGSTPHGGIYGVDASALKPRKLRWLWEPWIPLGAMAFLIADPGAGKSTLLCDLIACVTRGRKWPDGRKATCGKVLYYSIEENIGGGFLPRLKAAGADLRRVKVVNAEPSASAAANGGLSPLPEGARQIYTAIERHHALFVILDPVSDLFPAGADTNSEVAVRAALKALARLAEDTSCAIVCVRHLNKKSDAHPLYRMLGSNAFIQMPRSILQIDRDPEDDHGRVLSCIKSSYAIAPSPIRFRLASGRNDIVRVEWGAALDKGEAEAIAEMAGVTRHKLDEACKQLRTLLAKGPADAKSIETAMRSTGVADRTRYRAYAKLKVVKREVRDEKSGEIARWLLELPKKP